MSEGAYSVRNEGAYTAACSVYYWQNWRWQDVTVSILDNADSATVYVPIGSADVTVTCSVNTGGGWKEFVNKYYSMPADRTIVLGGTESDPTYSET